MIVFDAVVPVSQKNKSGEMLTNGYRPQPHKNKSRLGLVLPIRGGWNLIYRWYRACSILLGFCLEVPTKNN